MNKELKNVLSKTEPSNTNVVWYQPTEGGIIPKIFRGGWQALIQGAAGDNTQVIEWSHTHNMNDYKDAGTYRIKGERTGSPLDDNLPIMNSGSGHTLDGILYVLDSSLANGSGNSYDCTITQFLMLSNRVGGQEGDMYMRSAYGVNKDNLTWKPWEKYQTNMDVGVVSEGNTMNPQNPTQVLKFDAGMAHLIENGIYSGVYLGLKTMIGTTGDPYTIVINDPTAIETFVMVVINNYVAASNSRCITQIKFAVTNGGVFSMEKRSTTPGGNTYQFSQWESVGGGGTGLPEDVSFNIQDGDKYYFGRADVADLSIGSGVAVGNKVRIYNDVNIGEGVKICPGVKIGESSQNANIRIGDNIYIDEKVNIGSCVDIGGGVEIGENVTIGGDVSIASTVQIQPTIDAVLEQIYLGWLDDGRNLMFTYNPNNKILSIGNSHNGQHVKFGEGASIGSNVTIADNLKFSIANNILTITDGTNTWNLTAEA